MRRQSKRKHIVHEGGIGDVGGVQVIFGARVKMWKRARCPCTALSCSSWTPLHSVAHVLQ